MAKRVVQVLTVPRDGEEQPHQVGQLVDPGDGKDPFGTDPMTDKMLNGMDTRSAKFDYYYAGWSNGYVQTKAA